VDLHIKCIYCAGIFYCRVLNCYLNTTKCPSYCLLSQYRKDEGTVYEGQWVAGVRQGKGKISYSDGSYYRGDFQKDQMWGRGVYVGADGSQYDGEVSVMHYLSHYR